MGLISEDDHSTFETNGDGRELLVFYQTYKQVRRRKGRKERDRERDRGEREGGRERECIIALVDSSLKSLGRLHNKTRPLAAPKDVESTLKLFFKSSLKF